MKVVDRAAGRRPSEGASEGPSRRPVSIGVLVTAGIVPGIAWLLLVVLDSRLDSQECGPGQQATRWFGVSARLALAVMTAVAIVLTVAGAVALVHWLRLARRGTGKPARARVFLASSSLAALILFVPLVAASVVQVLAWRAC